MRAEAGINAAELPLQGDAYQARRSRSPSPPPWDPPPTSTKVSRFWCRAGSSSASANSNARRILLRSATASARHFRPGACSQFRMTEITLLHPGSENQVVIRAEATPVRSAEFAMIERASTSTPVTSPSRTVVFSLFFRMPRIGEAICPGPTPRWQPGRAAAETGDGWSDRSGSPDRRLL